MSAQRLLATTFVAAFLAVQLVVPSLALFGERPGRFGWHMYSALPRLPDAWIIRANGAEEPVDVAGRFANQRAEIDYLAALRAGLCGQSGVRAIRVAYPGREPETLTCD